MKPIVVNPAVSFENLLDGLQAAESEEQLAYQISQIVAKLHRRQRNMPDSIIEQFKYFAGGKEPKEYAQLIIGSKIPDAKKALLSCKDAFTMLDRDHTPRVKRPVVIDHHPDELVERTRGYGDSQRPEDYLEAFKQFITQNMNKIAALNIVCTKPAELTRESLKGLKLELDRHDFNEQQLNTAWNAMTNQDIVADIIAFIRQQALGSALISHDTRVKNAFAKLKLNHSFNNTQLEWLRRIERVLLEETVLDDQIFEMGAFKNAGGFLIIDRRFGGKLRDIITELNTYLYEDGAKTA